MSEPNMKGKVNLDDYKKPIYALVSAFVHKEHIGSITEEEIQKLYLRLKYEDYCVEHNMNYEDMTEDDFISHYEQESSFDLE